jgi:hypothetical protein
VVGVEWLRAIQDAGNQGLSTARLAAALGYESGRSIPFVATSLNKRLRDLGFDPKSVYEGRRVAGEQRWFAKERIEEAVKALQR